MKRTGTALLLAALALVTGACSDSAQNSGNGDSVTTNQYSKPPQPTTGPPN